MRHSEDFSDVVAALIKVQAALRRLTPGHEAKILQRNGKEFKYKHASLADGMDLLRPLLIEAKLAVLQPTSFADGMVIVETVIAHADGQWVAGETAVPLGDDMRGAQAVGSAITYGRRYGLFSLVGVVVAEEDDDGLAAATASAHYSRPRNDWSATEKFKRTALQAINALGTPEALEDWWDANGSEVASQPPDTVVEIKTAIARKHKMLNGDQPQIPKQPTASVQPATGSPPLPQAATKVVAPAGVPTPAASPTAPKPAAKKDEPKKLDEPPKSDTDPWGVFN